MCKIVEVQSAAVSGWGNCCDFPEVVSNNCIGATDLDGGLWIFGDSYGQVLANGSTNCAILDEMTEPHTVASRSFLPHAHPVDFYRPVGASSEDEHHTWRLGIKDVENTRRRWGDPSSRGGQRTWRC